MVLQFRVLRPLAAWVTFARLYESKWVYGNSVELGLYTSDSVVSKGVKNNYFLTLLQHHCAGIDEIYPKHNTEASRKICQKIPKLLLPMCSLRSAFNDMPTSHTISCVLPYCMLGHDGEI